jgi:hypothetical protein
MHRWLVALAVLVCSCGTVATPQPSPTAVAASSSPAGWICSSGSVLNKVVTVQPDILYVNGMDATTASGYDTVTVSFTNGVPDNRNRLELQNSATFTLSPRGDQVTLKGNHGILVTLRGADMHTSYAGTRDSVTGFPVVAEVRVVQDFEGVVQIALGINGAHCWLASFSSNPDRLTIEVWSAPYSSG